MTPWLACAGLATVRGQQPSGAQAAHSKRIRCPQAAQDGGAGPRGACEHSLYVTVAPHAAAANISMHTAAARATVAWRW